MLTIFSEKQIEREEKKALIFFRGQIRYFRILFSETLASLKGGKRERNNWSFCKSRSKEKGKINGTSFPGNFFLFLFCALFALVKIVPLFDFESLALRKNRANKIPRMA